MNFALPSITNDSKATVSVLYCPSLPRYLAMSVKNLAAMFESSVSVKEKIKPPSGSIRARAKMFEGSAAEEAQQSKSSSMKLSKDKTVPYNVSKEDLVRIAGILETFLSGMSGNLDENAREIADMYYRTAASDDKDQEAQNALFRFFDRPEFHLETSTIMDIHRGLMEAAKVGRVFVKPTTGCSFDPFLKNIKSLLLARVQLRNVTTPIIGFEKMANEIAKAYYYHTVPGEKNYDARSLLVELFDRPGYDLEISEIISMDQMFMQFALDMSTE